MAGLMHDKFNVAFIDVGGWDTHVNQGNGAGPAREPADQSRPGARRLRRSDGHAPGRKRSSSSSRSSGGPSARTARAAPITVTGAPTGCSAARSRAAASPASRSPSRPKTLNQNRDWPVMTEYRAMLGGLFRRMYSHGHRAAVARVPGRRAARPHPDLVESSDALVRIRLPRLRPPVRGLRDRRPDRRRAPPARAPICRSCCRRPAWSAPAAAGRREAIPACQVPGRPLRLFAQPFAQLTIPRHPLAPADDAG